MSAETVGADSRLVFDHLPTADELREAMVPRVQPPSVQRPSVDWSRTVKASALPVALALGSSLAARGRWRLAPWLALLAYAVLKAKPMALFAITVYQRYAPTAVRQSCLFEPCCSEYMRLAIEKHGLWAGARRGISRLARCHEPNGGIDQP
ncbi:MAG: membrane protein insertion efficiency factor YidD [Propionibacteriaceae bacterium]|jgi:putative component of membrane protein insertase Oxa1/YidC/SpoIIIJ protein YidD|nr:membrane protein insertion efficiency factor YidD [Propionibacteriaceae bacterium]